MSALDHDRVALILVEALFLGNVRAAEKWGITDRTIRNYRSRLKDDTALSDCFRMKKAEYEQNWVSDIPAAIKVGTQFLIKAFQEADHTQPEVIHAVAGAMKILAEIGLTKELIDVKLGKLDRGDGTADSQVEHSAALPAPTE